jgi:hypothetical protein
MHQVDWNPHQKGSSKEKSWTPEEWDAFTEANKFFSERKYKKKNRGKKRVQWWVDKKAGKKPRTSSGSAQQPPPADEQHEESQDATEEVFPPVPPGLGSDGSMVVAAPKKRPTGPQLPRAWFQVPRSPSLHGDSPGAMFHFPAGTTMWIPQQAMEHIAHGMPGGKGQAFVDNVIFPFNRTGWQSQLAPTIHVYDDDEEEVPVTGGSSSSTTTTVSKRIMPPWKRQGK